MSRYTVSWTPLAQRSLAEMWLNNPRSRADITNASDRIEQELADRPTQLGTETSSNVRLVALPPLAILFRIIEDDRQVRVIHVQFWEDDPGAPS